jgi:glycine/D-amino acid oxidase-like deaminating enzyme
MPEYDAIVIGTGQAGRSLALHLAAAGRKIAAAERKLVGGACVNTGGTPTKILVVAASAYAARLARRASCNVAASNRSSSRRIGGCKPCQRGEGSRQGRWSSGIAKRHTVSPARPTASSAAPRRPTAVSLEIGAPAAST